MSAPFEQLELTIQPKDMTYQQAMENGPWKWLNPNTGQLRSILIMSTDNDRTKTNLDFISDSDNREAVAQQVNDLVKLTHGLAWEAGWWTDKKTGFNLVGIVRDPQNAVETLIGGLLVGTKLALVHSEVSEGLEGARKNLMDDKLPTRKMIEVELADAIIRIGDLAGALGLDLGGAVAEKLLYNTVRADHKVENREAEGGKSF